MKLNPNQKHFAVSGGLTLILGIIVTGLLQLSADIAVYLWYYFPLILVYLYFEYVIMWRGRVNKLAIFFINGFFFILAGLTFFIIYFLVFYSSSKYTFEPADSCKIIGSMSPNFRGAERFSILYVDMVYQGKSMLGYGCISSESQGNISANINPSQFYESGETFKCPPIYKGPSYDLTSSRMLQQERQRITHFPNLKSNPTRRILKSTVTSCQTQYSFSNVKIPSWMCIPIKTSWKDMQAITKCKVAMYNNEALAWKAAEGREQLRKATDFAMVILQDDVFFPKFSYSMLVIFAYLPAMTSCIWIFYFVASSIPSIQNSIVYLNPGENQTTNEQEQQYKINQEIEIKVEEGQKEEES